MARWMKPEEELPSCEVGDRIVTIVVEKDPRTKAWNPRVVILEAEGYGVEDAVLWSLEKDLAQISHTICPEAYRRK